ncbi:MAG: hypothetical protein FWC01_02870, partial [Treponema sp.]|nr:hypothetical protein [Treponema sp.]MCL2236932.1 hypothetical protein [Treponema sp.]
VIIAWKYAEYYDDVDKSSGPTGELRRQRYDALIHKSSQLMYDIMQNKKNCYYYEPFYQLMRQTIWAEQMIAHNNIETISADDFMLLQVIPNKNIDLLEKNYACSRKDMPSTWRSCITDQSKFKIVSPEILLSGIGHKYDKLKEYLKTRYWTY